MRAPQWLPTRPATPTATRRPRWLPGEQPGGRRDRTSSEQQSRSTADQRLVLDPMGLVGVGARLLLTEGFVLTEVAFEPPHLRVAFEGEHMGGDAVEEPPVVADDHRAAGESLEGVFERPQRVD